ncbi:MAG: ribonuclease HII [Roseitalea sp.]|jgi:ribonuclease HII|nr:ribonuclease HII [Roseitalea sp.]MBO6721723.1 ribonuclease HII [Roseitalea sp.]MBO6743488.1 ribonuclease HII [Roseitalea sp.]
MTLHASGSPLLFEAGPQGPDFSFEDALRDSGHHCVAGVDEAGRGPLAGPVVAAAVVLDQTKPIEGLTDSKALTAKRRNILFDAVMADARAVSVASVCAASIDASDIRKASLAAMRACVTGLAPRADAALFDGRDVPPGLPTELTAKSVIKGDARCLSVAAASIVAKVSRDRMLATLCTAHPGYGLSGHKGYGSAAHRDAIGRLGGVVRLHRFTFRPLSER